jgi:lysyl-tRNA synthetase class 2
LRARIIHAIRRFFVDRGYLEVETPQLIPAPAPECHIDAVGVGDAFLHTSPELCMKRLLSAGYRKIFQICKCFRKGERGSLHLPEFTLLEWYHTGVDYMDLMGECEEMILSVSVDLDYGEKIMYQQNEIDLQTPWERMCVTKAFERCASISMTEALASGRFDEVMVEEIEPQLGVSKPTFLYDYPASLASLARLKANDPNRAERFELYMGGMEIANAFSELTDVIEQTERFEKERQKRHDLGKATYPMPDKFLNSLSYMPQSAGIALGVDRLVMVFANPDKIDDVVSFTPEEL